MLSAMSNLKNTKLCEMLMNFVLNQIEIINTQMNDSAKSGRLNKKQFFFFITYLSKLNKRARFDKELNRARNWNSQILTILEFPLSLVNFIINRNTRSSFFTSITRISKFTRCLMKKKNVFLIFLTFRALEQNPLMHSPFIHSFH